MLISHGKKFNFPCLFFKFSFVGNKLKRHLMAKTNDMGEKSALLNEPFISHRLKYNTLVIKHKQLITFICTECYLYFDLYW